MKNKKLTLIIIGISVVILLIVLINLYSYFYLYGFHLIGNTNRSIVYESKNGSYSMRFPGGWHENEITKPSTSNQHLVTTFETIGMGNFINVQKYNDAKLSLNDLKNIEIKNISSLKQFEYLKNSDETIGQYSGVLLETINFRQFLNKEYLHHCYSWIIPENGGYIFLFCAANSKWQYAKPIFMDMMESIELIESPQ